MDNEFVKLRALVNQIIGQQNQSLVQQIECVDQHDSPSMQLSQSKTSNASIISAGSSSQEPLQKPSEESLIDNSLNIWNIFSLEMA